MLFVNTSLLKLRNTYQSQLHTLMLLQKKAYVQYKCLNCLDIVKLKTLLTVYKAKNNVCTYQLWNQLDAVIRNDKTINLF